MASYNNPSSFLDGMGLREDLDEIRIELAALLRDKEPGVQHSLATADAIMERFEIRRK